MGLLGLRQRLEPVGDSGESFFARRLGHSRIHVRVFVRFTVTADCRFRTVSPSGRSVAGIADLLQIIQMPVRMTRLAFGGVPEIAGNFRVTFDVRHLCEVQIAPVRLDSPAKASFRFPCVFVPFNEPMEPPLFQGSWRNRSHTAN